MASGGKALVGLNNTSQVQLQGLPQTSSSAMYHSLCVYFHVQQWKGAGETMSIEEWG